MSAASARVMNAIALLEQQHDDIAELFRELDRARSPEHTAGLFEQLGDLLAVHLTIEEQIFYPAIELSDFDTLLLESLEQHLSAKRVLADLLALPPTEEHFAAKLAVLREQILHHFAIERARLFPRARAQLADAALRELGDRMADRAAELEQGIDAPRWRLPAETRHTPTLH